MINSYRSSFLTLVTLAFLLPLFFIPGGILDLASTKSFLIVLGVVVAAALLLYESFKAKTLSLPKHYLLLVVGLLPLIYLLSSLLATPSSLSLLGYNLEIGTFGYILIGFLATLLGSMVFSDTSRVLQLILALFGTLIITALFVIVKIVSGGSWLVLGNFSGNMGNPLGAWTDLGMIFGLLSLLTILALGMLPMKRSFKIALYLLTAVSMALFVIVSFSTAFFLMIPASFLLFLYFHKIESGFLFSASKDEVPLETPVSNKSNFFSKPTFLPLVLLVVSLLFAINPTLPNGRTLGEVVSSAFGVINSDVKPTFSTTLGISKAVLSQDALLGSGPNTFSSDWLIYKPADVNITPFWSTTFLFGAGFIPTQIAATGVAGSILWLAFYVLLLILAFKLVSRIPEARASRFVMMGALITTLFLWAGAIIYTPSSAILMLAFLFLGALLAQGRLNGVLGSYSLEFKEGTNKTFIPLLLGVLMVAVVAFGWVGLERTLASFHFKQAVDLSNAETPDLNAIEAELGQAINFAPLDVYYRARAMANFSQAQEWAAKTEGVPEENRTGFEEALGQSLEDSRTAVVANPASYLNWVSLGAIYSALVPAPLQIQGAYENSQYAYLEAQKRNPNNPEIPLLLAQLEINRGEIDQARSHIRTAITLKENYAEAYVLLARLEVSQNNLPVAIASSERLAALLPDNAGVHFELGLLKQANSDYIGAANSFARALELEPQYANAKYYLALSLAKMGQLDQARALLEDLLEKEPDNAVIKEALELLK